MDPRKIYEELVKSITDVEMRKVARTLTYHVGETHPVFLEDLARAAYGKAGETEKRKVREIIETLIEVHGMPVCSHSGKAGRWLAATHEEAIEAAKEREARADKLRLSAQKLRAARLPAREPRIGLDDQMGLF